MTSRYEVHHPNFFNQYTAITTVDADTVVVTALAGNRIFITDLIVQSNQTAALGSWTLTDAASVTMLGPLEIVDQVLFVAHFKTPLVNQTRNSAVHFDKTAGEDDWEVYIAGYYAP